MVQRKSIFEQFGGIRPMARALGLPSSNVGAWKTKGRIPADKQPHVLAVAKAQGLPITAEDVVFPFGCPASDLAPTTARVACGRPGNAQ